MAGFAAFAAVLLGDVADRHLDGGLTTYLGVVVVLTFGPVVLRRR